MTTEAADAIAIDDRRSATPPPRRRVCFSFAAYAKAVIEHLRGRGVPVADGLSDPEVAAIESAYGFCFPPDLRSILREGLPTGAGFPNWRASSPQQLRILLALPVSTLLNEVSKGRFWRETWGTKPASPTECVAIARKCLERAPPLVPIYRHFYMPSALGIAGNPVFSVRGGEVRCAGFDLADFFQREEFELDRLARPVDRAGAATPAPVPAWAAKSAMRVELWTELAEGDTWRGVGWARGRGMEGWLREMGWTLRDAGWGEEEVTEMLTVSDGEGEVTEVGPHDRTVLRDRESVQCHVRLLALVLLRAGWCADDVVYAMGRSDDHRPGRASSASASAAAMPTWQVDPTQNEISIEITTTI